MLRKPDPLRRSLVALAGLPPLSQADLARHWCVDPDTARHIIADSRLAAVPGPHKTARYAWADIWRFEGVPPSDITCRDRHADLMEPLLTAADLAEAFGCTPATIRNRTRDGLLPAIRLKSSYRYRRSAIPWF